MMECVLARPAGTIQGVFDNPAELHGAYDFVENEHVDPQAMLLAMTTATAARANAQPFVWIPTDGSSLAVTDRTQTKGTGRVGSSTGKGRGDQVHTALVLDREGVPLGVAALESWQRGPKSTRAQRAKRPTEQKETQRWLSARATIRATLSEVCPGLVRHYLHDRGADAWPVILDAIAPREGEFTTIRAAWDRRLWRDDATADAATTYLRQALVRAPLLGAHALEVAAGPRRKARTATLEVRACQVTLDLRNKQTREHAPATVYVVCAREVSAVPAGEKPLEWLLLTTYPIRTLEDATFVVDGYALRWVIERFHAAWKSAGTDVEASQLHAAKHRARWHLVLAAAAATLLRWQMRAVRAPDTPADQEFTPEQIEAIRDMQKDEVVPETGPVTLWQVIVALAYLGGWAGSRTRPPGITVLTRGWRRVMAYLQGQRRAAQRARSRLTGATS